MSTTKPRSEPFLRSRSDAARRELLEAEVHDLTEELRESRARESALESRALRDPLTGLMNRQAFGEQLETELARAERENRPVTVVMLDLDVFKQINDLYGHGVGDEVLRGIAERLASGVRPGDLCGRAGGDEFMLGLVGAASGTAEEILERLGTAVASMEFGPGAPSLSVSAGIAEYPRHALDRAELMERADAALYRAKATGRNRFCVASSEAHPGRLRELGTGERHRMNVQNTVTALARALDARNGYTHLHSHAVAHYAASLGQALGMDADRVEALRRAGVLHDVGKVGMPDAILWKAGPLSEEEAAVVRRHSETGRDILVGAGLPDIADWVCHLHERVDGAGYPDGVAGAEIPRESRVLKVADALDAMTSPRLYQAPLSGSEALAELERGAGTEFDPEVVAALVVLVRTGKLVLHTDERRERGTVPD